VDIDLAIFEQLERDRRHGLVMNRTESLPLEDILEICGSNSFGHSQLVDLNIYSELFEPMGNHFIGNVARLKEKEEPPNDNVGHFPHMI